MLTIAIDFDGTFSADPDLWREIVGVMTGRRYGHKCILVTNRPEAMGNDVRAEVGDLMPIVFAGAQSKRSAAENAGYFVNIWIDDNPGFIGVDGVQYVGTDRPDTEEG